MATHCVPPRPRLIRDPQPRRIRDAPRIPHLSASEVGLFHTRVCPAALLACSFRVSVGLRKRETEGKAWAAPPRLPPATRSYRMVLPAVVFSTISTHIMTNRPSRPPAYNPG